MSLTSAREREIEKEFENCFKQFFKPLCFYAMRLLKDEEIAKDVVHDVFLSVWGHRRNIDFSRAMYPYFLSLTRNKSLNYLAHQKVKADYENKGLLQECIELGENDWEHEELIGDIIQRIDQLPDRCRVVMKMCFIECKHYKEIANSLGISVNTVKTHISTGLKILREEFPASLLFILLSALKKVNI